MSFVRRVHTIYKKELIDILRDRRTLIAMILVPIVLYPLLMLGSIQAVTALPKSLDKEQVIIGVISEAHGRILLDLIKRDAEATAFEYMLTQPKEDWPHGEPSSLKDMVDIRLFESEEIIEQAIQARAVEVGIIFGDSVLRPRPDQQNTVKLLADEEEVRSSRAQRRIENLFARTADRMIKVRLSQENLPATLVEPFTFTWVNLSAPSSILGQILPLILVLMTITGAIYPAIDLTAGERERGTLESLMVCPVSVFDLIVGKFLVVTTVALMGAALNLASVTATVYFGGFDQVISSTGDGVPIGKMFLILLCLVPFAVLASAMMIAVCSYARTFKEAQNYVTPVIMAVLIPGGLAAMPGSRLEGIMLVMPVGNMVLLSRDLLLGAVVPFGQIVMVILSTSLYAASAVAIAASVFGKESVIFADAGSLRSMFSRSLYKPTTKPDVSLALLVAALLFPTWFFVQASLSPTGDEGAEQLLYGTGLWMPIFFVVLPAMILLYRKIALVPSFGLGRVSLVHLLAAVLIGVAAWVPSHEFHVFQQMVLPIPEAAMTGMARMEEAIKAMDPAMGLLLLALIPALCEEMFFRGLLLSGLRTAAKPWTAILASAAIFGLFHFVIFKFATTAALGVVLAYLCYRSGSILPGIVAHLLHNGLALSSAYWPWREAIGIDDEAGFVHLPPVVLIVGFLVFTAGVAIVALSPRRMARERNGARAS